MDIKSYKTKNLNADTCRIGLIILQSDATLELEFQKTLAKSNITCHHARIQNATEVTTETLAEMKLHLPKTAALLPQELNLKAIGYACTSGSVAIGSDQIEKLIQKYHPNVKVTNPMDAAIKACQKLKLKNIAYLSPYIAEVSKSMRDEFNKNNINIASFASFNEIKDNKVATISEESVLQALIDLENEAQCDGFFVSCTNLRTFAILQQAEKILKKPVLSSNQTLLWNLLKLSRNEFKPQKLGKLFSQ